MDEEVDYWLGGEGDMAPPEDDGPLFPVRDEARERGQSDEEIERLYGEVRRRENERRAAQGLGPDPRPYSGPRIYNFDVGNRDLSRRQQQAEQEAYSFAQRSLGRGLDSEQRDRMEMAQALRNPEFSQADQMRLNQLQAGRTQVERQVAMGQLSMSEGRQLLTYINSGASMLQARRYQTLESQRKLREKQMMDQQAKAAALVNAEGVVNAQELLKRITTDDAGNMFTVDRNGDVRLLGNKSRGGGRDEDDAAIWKRAELEAEVAAARQGIPVADPKTKATVFDRLIRERDTKAMERGPRGEAADPERKATAIVENMVQALKNYHANPSREAAKALQQERDELLQRYPGTKAAEVAKMMRLPDATYQPPKTAGQAISALERGKQEVQRREQKNKDDERTMQQFRESRPARGFVR